MISNQDSWNVQAEAVTYNIGRAYVLRTTITLSELHEGLPPEVGSGNSSWRFERSPTCCHRRRAVAGRSVRRSDATDHGRVTLRRTRRARRSEQRRWDVPPPAGTWVHHHRERPRRPGTTLRCAWSSGRPGPSRNLAPIGPAPTASATTLTEPSTPPRRAGLRYTPCSEPTRPGHVTPRRRSSVGRPIARRSSGFV